MFRSLVYLTQSIIFAMAVVSTVWAEEARFPSLRSTNLNGEEIALPGGLAGERNLVLIAFQREQQKDIDTWLKAMPALVEANPKFHYYECPTIQKMTGVVRFFINSGMRGGIPDKQQRARTITLYIDKAPFKKSLQIQSEATIYAVLIDQSGRVLWRADGTFDDAKGRSLRDALRP